MGTLRSNAEFEKFLDSLDGEKLMREADRARLVREYEANREDWEQARVHILARLVIEHRYELLSLEEARRTGFDQQQREAQQNAIRMKVEDDLKLELVKATAEIQQRRVSR